MEYNSHITKHLELRQYEWNLVLMEKHTGINKLLSFNKKTTFQRTVTVTAEKPSIKIFSSRLF